MSNDNRLGTECDASLAEDVRPAPLLVPIQNLIGGTSLTHDLQGELIPARSVLNRRGFLGAIGVAALPLLAACAGQPASSTTPTTGATSPTTSATSPTAASTASTAAASPSAGA